MDLGCLGVLVGADIVCALDDWMSSERVVAYIYVELEFGLLI